MLEVWGETVQTALLVTTVLLVLKAAPGKLKFQLQIKNTLFQLKSFTPGKGVTI